jgi:hypothetical protein
LFCKPNPDKEKGKRCRERALQKLIQRISNPHLNTDLLLQIAKRHNLDPVTIQKFGKI